MTRSEEPSCAPAAHRRPLARDHGTDQDGGAQTSTHRERSHRLARDAGPYPGRRARSHVKRLEQYFLEEGGFAVEFADDGLQAIELARKLRPAIVITEILVPKADGLKVCRTLKGEAATRHIVILIFSILAAEDRAREAGADGFLRKPLNETLLMDSVRKLIQPTASKGLPHESH